MAISQGERDMFLASASEWHDAEEMLNRLIEETQMGRRVSISAREVDLLEKVLCQVQLAQTDCERAAKGE